jgi:hypothetical protein
VIGEAEFVQCVFQAMACTVQIDTVHHGSRLPPAPPGPTGNGSHHLQIPQQSSCRRLDIGLLLAAFAAGLEKQHRFFVASRGYMHSSLSGTGVAGKVCVHESDQNGKLLAGEQGRRMQHKPAVAKNEENRRRSSDLP